MNRTLRRIIFVFFVSFFFLSAAILLLYANGYRYHAGKNGIEKTGQILVETQPKGAHMLLNGVRAVDPWSHAQLTSPATVPYLFSGQVHMTVSLDGFHDWNGDVSVLSGRTTIKNDIILLKQVPPVLISKQAHIKNPQKVKDGIVFDDGRTIYFLNTRSGEVVLVYTSPTPISELDATPSGTRFVLKNSDGWHVVEQGRNIFSGKITAKKPMEFRWAQDDTLYVRDDKGISIFDKNTSLSTPMVIQTKIIDFIIDTEIAVLSGGLHPLMTFFDLHTGKQTRQLTSIPPATRIRESDNGFLVLDGENDSLYLLSRQSEKPFLQQVTDAHDIVFLSNNHFFTSNDFEIWTHDFSNDRYTRSLVTRQSEPLTQVLPLTTIPFIITVSGGKNIRARDLRVQDATVGDILLASFDAITAVVMDTKETTLWVFGSRDGKSGIYSLPIIEREELFPLVK